MSDTYRGWTIHQGQWPEPAWMATGPNYDASYEGPEDGWVDNGEKADAPTREALLAEIDAHFEENAINDREAAWLVEMTEPEENKPPVPRWWHPEHGWTWDVNKALRFCRKQDAADYIKHSGGAGRLLGKPTHHLFIGA